MAKRILLGFIGANIRATWAAQSHFPALLASPDVELTAVCTTRRETAEAPGVVFPRVFQAREEVGVLSRLLSSGGHGPAAAAGGRTTERSGGVGAQVPPRTAEKGTTSRDADSR